VIGSNRYIMFTYSLTGPAGLGETVDTISSVLTNGFHSNPDVAYDHGKFYVVFGDRVAQKIYLMESALYGTIGIENVSSSIPSIRISGNITGDAITISSNKSMNEHCMISIFNCSGVLCERFEMNNLQHTQTIKLDRSLTNGLYFVSVASSDFVVSEKMVVVR